MLGALSLLLNGGGVEQIQKISHELNDALSGNEPEIRALLSRVDELATQLDGHRTEILRAIDGLGKLSHTLTGQTQNLTNALDNLAPGLKIVTDQRDQLVGMLNALNTLSGVAVDTVTKSRDQLVANLKALQPTLTKLGEAGSEPAERAADPAHVPVPGLRGQRDQGRLRERRGEREPRPGHADPELHELVAAADRAAFRDRRSAGPGRAAVAAAGPRPGPQAAGPGLLGGLLGLIGGGR